MAFKLYTETSGDKNSAYEKTIILACISAIIAIFLDGKNKKPKKRKNFIARTAKNYSVANSAVNSYSAYRKKKQAAQEYEGIRLEKAQPIDIEL